MPSKRFAIDAGGGPVDLVKIQDRPTGDQYVVFLPFPTGLHASYHASGKMHIRDSFGTYETLGRPQPPDDPMSLLEEWRYEPSHGEDLVAFSSFDLDPSKYVVSKPKTDTWLLGQALEDLPLDRLWSVHPDHIDRFVHKHPKGLNLFLDEHAGEMVLAAAVGKDTLAISMPFELDAFTTKIRSISVLNPVLDPMFRAMEQSSQRATEKPELRAKMEGWAKRVAGAEGLELERLAERRWIEAPRMQFQESHFG